MTSNLTGVYVESYATRVSVSRGWEIVSLEVNGYWRYKVRTIELKVGYARIGVITGQICRCFCFFLQLEKLDLEYCSQVTDFTLIQLATYCPRINTLVLSHCDQITDEGISRLVGGLCGPQQLQRLAMDNCPLLTDSSLEMLGSVCQNLRQVDLYDCQLITRQGIENLKVG